MVRDEKYFYLSGVLTLLIFLLFSFSFAHLLFNVSTTKKYGLKKDNFVSISLTTPKVTKQRSTKKTTKAAPVAPVVNEPVKNIDVNDLFSDVWTQKIDHKKQPEKKVNSKRIQEIAKRVKTSEKKEVSSVSELIAQQETVKSNDEELTSSTGQEVNEYNAKIQAIVYEHFIPPANSEGHQVTVVLELDPFGKMIDLRVLTYSANDALNAEADKIKQRLFGTIFPKSPDNMSSRIKINLIPENKE